MSDELKFEAKDKPLSTVFFSERKYRVPRYQRPYTWDSEQITEFWEDLTAQGEPYFFGSMIFNTEAEKSNGYADIIDGQQRLLTVTILTAVLRDLASELDKERARLYQRKDIAIEDRDGMESYRVLPSDPLKNYFHTFVQSGEGNILLSSPSTQEEARVKRNYEYFREKVSAELKRGPTREGQLDLLSKLRKRIGDLIVISIEIGREEDAYDIFETTNARGIELSVSDLLKNLIFNRIRAGSDRDVAKDTWQEISNNIESTRTELKRFIRYYWISKYGFTPDKKLYRTIKSKVTDWQGLLQDLQEDSERYNFLLESGEQDFQDLKHGSRIYAAVSALRLMRVSQCYILLLCVLRNMSSLNTDPTRIFELIERFTFQYAVVCKYPSNRLDRIYSRYALSLEQAVREGQDKRVAGRVQAIFSELEKELKSIAPPEEVFKASFMDFHLKNSEEDRQLVKYILSEIDGYYSKTDEHRIDFSTVNIEHILPQNPHKDWQVTKKDIRDYVNKLGNLTLLSKRINSKVQNAPIDQKLPELATSELHITKQLVKTLQNLNCAWGEDQIRQRQVDLADIAYRHIWAF